MFVILCHSERTEFSQSGTMAADVTQNKETLQR